MELLLLAAIAYAAARGVESIVGDTKERYGSKVADAVVKKAAKNRDSGKDEKADATKPGGTFSARDAAPRTASLGTKTAAGIATGVETGATFWKSYRDGYREAWPTARDEARRRQVERAKRRQAEREARLEERRAATAEKKAADAEAKPPVVTVAAPDAAETVAAPEKDQVQEDTAPAAPAAQTDAPAPADKPALTLVKNPDPEPEPEPAPAPIGDNVIPEVRTLDGLIHALGITRNICLMRAEEAEAVAADDAALSGRLDAIEAELAEMEVDPGTLAEVSALRDQIAAQSAAAQQYGAAAHNAADLATGAADAAHKSHGGINEAVQSAPIEAAAQAGYYNR